MKAHSHTTERNENQLTIKKNGEKRKRERDQHAKQQMKFIIRKGN